MRFDLLTISITLLAVSLLLSSLKDMFSILGPISLLERNIESVADPINESLILHFGLDDV
jgi:hypothetical protein